MSEQLERSQDPARRRHLPPQETPAETPPEKREDAEGEQKGKRRGAPETPGRWESIRSGLLSLVTNNWGYKLLSVFLALVIWAVLISQDPKLTRDKVFVNVPVRVVGLEGLREDRYIIVDGLDPAPTVTGTAEVPQLVFEEAEAAAYDLRLDVSAVRTTGEVEQRILWSSGGDYGAVTAITPATVKYTVDRYRQKTGVPVVVSISDSAPEGWYMVPPVSDPLTVDIAGPERQINAISQVTVAVKWDALTLQEGNVEWLASLTVVDDEGNAMDPRLLEISSDGEVLSGKVKVSSTLYPTRRIELSGMTVVTGTPADGYEIKSVNVTPTAVLVAGAADVLEGQDVLYVEAPLDVSGLSASVSGTLQIHKPEELVYLRQTTATVAVEIGEIIRRKTFESVPITLTGIGAGLTATLAQSTATVTVTGGYAAMEKVSAEDLRLWVDISGLESGVHGVGIACEIVDESVTGCTVEVLPGSVQVELSGP